MALSLPLLFTFIQYLSCFPISSLIYGICLIPPFPRRQTFHSSFLIYCHILANLLFVLLAVRFAGRSCFLFYHIFIGVASFRFHCFISLFYPLRIYALCQVSLSRDTVLYSVQLNKYHFILFHTSLLLHESQVVCFLVQGLLQS